MSKNNLQYFLLGLILLVHAFLLTKLIFFPYPELFIYPYLTNHGLLPYKQILDQHFPGLMFLPINLDNLGMNTPEVARIWSIAIVILTQIILFLISSKILKSSAKALLVNILYLIWQPFFEGWVLWIDNFLPILLLPAFYFLYNRKFFTSGILIGLAIVFKQVLIPLSVLLALYVWWETSSEFKKLKDFFIGLAIPVFLMVAYLISIGVFNDFFYWTVIFNLTVYAKYGRGEGTDFAHISRVVLVFGSAFLSVVKIKERSVQILLIFLIGSLIGLSTRFDFVHFQPALPFAILATVYGLGGFRKLERLGIITLYGLATFWWLIIFYRGHLGDRVIAFDLNIRKLTEKIKDYTEPSEKIFVFGAAPHLYQMSNTLPAGDIFVFQFPWFLQVAEDRVLEGIKSDKPEIVVSNREVDIDGQKITEFAKSIDLYIQENYYLIDNVGSTEILQRK